VSDCADEPVRKSDLDSRTQEYLSLFRWLVGSAIVFGRGVREGRTGSADRSWQQQMWSAAFRITRLKVRFEW